MVNTKLLNKILHQLQENNWNKTMLSQKSGLHLSEISRILNSKQSLSLHNLDTLTRAFELTEDTFYPYYVMECFLENGFLNKRRSEQFLYRCAEKGFKEPLQQILDSILEERSKPILSKNLDLVFTVAEALFKDGNEKQSLRLYETIIESMPNHNSEQVAISYYRKFYLVIGTEEEESAITLVLKHLQYMPYEFQILSYFWIVFAFYDRQQWHKALYYAKFLEQSAREGEYYAEGLLYQAFALRRLGGTLEEIIELIDRSSKVNEYYEDIAIGNRFITYINYEKFDCLDQYLSWAEGRNDLYISLPHILEGLVKSERIEDAGLLLNRHQQIFEKVPPNNELRKMKVYLHFRYAVGLYLCARNQIEEGLHELLDVANKAHEFGYLKRFKKCIQVYWKYKYHVNDEHELKFMHLLSS